MQSAEFKLCLSFIDYPLLFLYQLFFIQVWLNYVCLSAYTALQTNEISEFYLSPIS